MRIHCHTKSGYERFSGSGDTIWTKSQNADTWSHGHMHAVIPIYSPYLHYREGITTNLTQQPNTFKEKKQKQNNKSTQTAKINPTKNKNFKKKKKKKKEQNKNKNNNTEQQSSQKHSSLRLKKQQQTNMKSI